MAENSYLNNIQQPSNSFYKESSFRPEASIAFPKTSPCRREQRLAQVTQDRAIIWIKSVGIGDAKKNAITNRCQNWRDNDLNKERMSAPFNSTFSLLIKAPTRAKAAHTYEEGAIWRKPEMNTFTLITLYAQSFFLPWSNSRNQSENSANR